MFQGVTVANPADMTDQMKEQLRNHLLHMNRYFYIPPRQIETEDTSKPKIDLALFQNNEDKDDNDIARE